MLSADGTQLLSITSSISSSISQSITQTVSSFNGTVSLNKNSGTFQWNTDFAVYYVGYIGGTHTELSPVTTFTHDSVSYTSFILTLDNGISLSPGTQSIDNNGYEIWVKDLNNNTWYHKPNQTLTTLQSPGLTINLSGKTSTNFDTDLNNAGFVSGVDPTSYINNITFNVNNTLSYTSSIALLKSQLNVNSVSGSRIYPTSSGIPTFSGSDGQFVFGTTSGKYYIYTWMSNAWRSGSLV
jgi:hypothetical protein